MQIAFASLLWSIEGKARLYCCSRKMSVTCLFFSLNKLNHYFPGLLTRWRSRINKIPAYFCQTNRSLRPISISVIGNPLFLITSLKLGRGSAQQRTKREDYLHLGLQTYCRFMGRTHLISLSLHLEHYLQSMPLLPSLFPRLSVSCYNVSTNTGTTCQESP